MKNYRSGVLIAVFIGLVLGLLFLALNAQDQPSEPENDGIVDNEEVDSGAVSSHGVLDAAKSIPELTSLTEAFNSTDLPTTLSAAGEQYTIFAPMNEALALFATENPDASESYLEEVLTLHVSSGIIMGENLVTAVSIPTLNGSSLSIVQDEQGLLLQGPNGTARIVAVDLKAANGVVHLIDKVLIP